MLNKLLAPIRRRIDNMIARAVLTLVDDTLKLQGVQVQMLPDELRTGERFQQYGLTANPLIGAEAVVVFVGGFRDHPLVLAVDDRRYRPKNLEPGEVMLYTDEGDSVKLARGRIVEVIAGNELNVTCPSITFTGSLHVTGSITADGDVTASGTSLHTHKHSGVTAGGAQTGVPV